MVYIGQPAKSKTKLAFNLLSPAYGALTLDFVDIVDSFYCYATKEEAKEMNVIKD